MSNLLKRNKEATPYQRDTEIIIPYCSLQYRIVLQLKELDPSFHPFLPSLVGVTESCYFFGGTGSYRPLWHMQE